MFRRDLVTDQGKAYEMGWASVLALLRSNDQFPVVTSYSVTERWPDVTVVREFGDWHPKLEADPDSDEGIDEYTDAFYDEPNAWAIAMDALRKADESLALEISPRDFSTMRFGSGQTADDVIRAAERMVVA